MRRARAIVAGALGATLVVGCSPSEPDLPVVTASPAATTTPTPTPSATPSGPSDLSDPELGIVFTDFPRDQDEQTAAAVEAYMLFETEFWKALTTNVVPPGPWAVASDKVIAWIQGQVGPNSENGWNAAGTYRTSVEIVTGDDVAMTLDVCKDWREVTFENVDGTVTSAVDGGLDETSGSRLTMDNSSSPGWKVLDYELTGPC